MPNPQDVDAWNAYIHNTESVMERRVKQEVTRLQKLGIIDEQGNLLSDRLPADMLPGAVASVVTG
jgi:hypothetical protein